MRRLHWLLSGGLLCAAAATAVMHGDVVRRPLRASVDATNGAGMHATGRADDDLRTGSPEDGASIVATPSGRASTATRLTSQRAIGDVVATPGFPFAGAIAYQRMQPDIHSWEDFVTVAVGDFNGDRRDDIAALLATNTILVYLQGGDGQLQEPDTWVFAPPVYLHQRSEMVVADFNEDGVADLATSTVADGHVMNLMLSDGQGGQVHAFLDGYMDLLDWSTLDADQDGHADIVGFERIYDYDGTLCGAQYGNCSRVRLFFGDGHGRFRAGYGSMSQGTAWGLDAADIDSDGLRDLVYEVQAPGQQVLNVYYEPQLRQGGFGPRVFMHAGSGVGTGPVFGDFNTDGRADSLLVPTYQADYPQVRLRAATGAFPATPDLVPAWDLRANWPLVADFNNDGRADMASVQLRPAQFLSDAIFAINLQGPDGRLLPPEESAPNFALDKISMHRHAMAAGDFNGDGCLDAAIAADSEGLIVYTGKPCVRRKRMPNESGGRLRKP